MRDWGFVVEEEGARVSEKGFVVKGEGARARD